MERYMVNEEEIRTVNPADLYLDNQAANPVDLHTGGNETVDFMDLHTDNETADFMDFHSDNEGASFMDFHSDNEGASFMDLLTDNEGANFMDLHTDNETANFMDLHTDNETVNSVDSHTDQLTSNPWTVDAQMDHQTDDFEDVEMVPDNECQRFPSSCFSQTSPKHRATLLNSLAIRTSEMEGVFLTLLEFVPKGQIELFLSRRMTCEDFMRGRVALMEFLGRQPCLTNQRPDTWLVVVQQDVMTWRSHWGYDGNGIETPEDDPQSRLVRVANGTPALESFRQKKKFVRNAQSTFYDAISASPESLSMDEFADVISTESNPLIRAEDICQLRQEAKDVSFVRTRLAGRIHGMQAGPSSRGNVWAREARESVAAGAMGGRDMTKIMKSRGRGSALYDSISIDDPYPEPTWGAPVPNTPRPMLIGGRRFDHETTTD